eukprot:14145522-Ditylum_brightwellii.AAC.1
MPSPHLKIQENEKKTKYLARCLEQRKIFTSFVATVDGVLEREASMTLKQMTHAVLKKWACPVPKTQNYINTMISIAIVCATHRCLRGYHIPSKFTNPDLLPFEDGAGLTLDN